MLKADEGIYTDIQKGTKQKTYQDKISFCNDFYFFKLLEDTDFVPALLETEENSITAPVVSGNTLLNLLRKYDEGQFSLDKLMLVFTELLSKFQMMEQRLSSQLHRYFNFDYDLFNNLVLTDENQLFLTSFASVAYAEQYDLYATVIALASNHVFKDSSKKTMLTDALIGRYAQGLAISQDTLQTLVKSHAIALKRKTSIRKKMEKTTGVLLTGGKSSRMDFTPKFSLKIGNFTFFEHIVHTLSCFDDLLISNNERIKHYTTISDMFIGIGPIGGIHAALNSTKKNSIFITACDMPNISQELIEYLFEHLKEKDDCLIPVIDGRIHPLCAIYRKRVMPVIKAQINRENYKLRMLLENTNTHYVDVPENFRDDLFNVNTFELYEEELKKARKRSNFTPLTFAETKKPL